MVSLPEIIIPGFPDEEMRICSDQVLSESDQKAVAELISGIQVYENKMIFWDKNDLWNYHDESWTEYDYICVFRITGEIYEKNRAGSDAPGKYMPYSSVLDKAEECFVKRSYEKGSITIKYNSAYTTDLMWTVYDCYVKDLEGIPGYLHIVWANGSDRSFVN